MGFFLSLTKNPVIILLLNLAIGLTTPPVGAGRDDCVLLSTTYVPWFTTFLASLTVK